MMRHIPVCKHLVRVPAQRAWVTISVFHVFYIDEVLLFWNGLALAAPLMEIAVIISIDLSIGIMGRIWMDPCCDHQAGRSKPV
jgi:hypothetical protein